jgi:hypothetical protein
MCENAFVYPKNDAVRCTLYTHDRWYVLLVCLLVCLAPVVLSSNWGRTTLGCALNAHGRMGHGIIVPYSVGLRWILAGRRLPLCAMSAFNVAHACALRATDICVRVVLGLFAYSLVTLLPSHVFAPLIVTVLFERSGCLLATKLSRFHFDC